MNYPIQSVLGNEIVLLEDVVDYITDYYDGETEECLVFYVDHPTNARNPDLRGVVSCDVSQLPEFITLPGVSRVMIDTHNGFRPLWNAKQ